MGDEQQLQRFWVVYSKDDGRLARPNEFSDFHAATKECERMAGLHPECVFVVLESVAAWTAHVHVHSVRVDGDQS